MSGLQFQESSPVAVSRAAPPQEELRIVEGEGQRDRKSTRLNSSHL